MWIFVAVGLITLIGFGIWQTSGTASSTEGGGQGPIRPPSDEDEVSPSK